MGPATGANVARNARAEGGRLARWAPARDALWALLEPALGAGARVAVVGAGNADDLPLVRLAGRAGAVALLDVDPAAGERARARVPPALRPRVAVERCDVTAGAADAAVRRAAQGRAPEPPAAAAGPLPGAPYDLVVGDLLYSQLVYPALVDLGLAPGRVRGIVAACAPWLLGGVVARLHASAPRVAHVHDPAAWWTGHPQPRPLTDVLRDGRLDGLRGPRAWDPRPLLAPDAVLSEAVWHWPFKPGVDYLVRGTLVATDRVTWTGTRAAVFRCQS